MTMVRDGVFFFRVGKVSIENVFESMLSKTFEYANAPATERLCREGPQRPVDVGSGWTETKCRRGEHEVRANSRIFRLAK